MWRCVILNVGLSMVLQFYKTDNLLHTIAEEDYAFAATATTPVSDENW